MGKEQKLLDQAKAHLEPGEQIAAGVLGKYEAKIMGADSVRNGILLATDRRVVFYAKKMTGYDLESYPYSSISSIEQGKNMTGHNVTFYASGNKIEVKWIQDVEKLARFMNSIKPHIHARTTTPPPTPTTVPLTTSPSEPDVIDQLRRLGELRDAGVVTVEEFEAKKAEMLRRL